MAKRVRLKLNYFLTLLLGMLGFTYGCRVKYGPEPPMPMYGPAPIEEQYQISVSDNSLDDWETVDGQVSVAVSDPGSSRRRAAAELAAGRRLPNAADDENGPATAEKLEVKRY